MKSTGWRNLNEAVRSMSKQLSEEKQEALGSLTEEQYNAIVDVLQLDEVSASKLGRYISKSVDDEKDHRKKQDKALDDNDMKSFDKHGKKQMNRYRGRQRAIDKLNKSHSTKVNATNEEIERLDELSKKTLGSYVKKAKNSGRDLETSSREQMKVGLNSKDTKTAKAYMKAADKNYAKSKKRNQGIDRAVDKLTKEEIERLDSINEEFSKE